MIGDMHNPKGFTLVELLVAAALFATVIAVSVNLFILALRKPLVEVDSQHLQEEVTYLFESLSQRMTESTIAYSFYSSPMINPVDALYVTDVESDQVYRYYLSANQVFYENVSSGVSYPVTTTLNNDVAIDSLRFYIYPKSDPTDPAAGVNYQPTVVVAVTGHSVQDATRTFKVQTMLTTRLYVR